MSNWQQTPGGFLVASPAVDLSTEPGGFAFVNATWTEMVASTDYPVDAMQIIIHRENSTFYQDFNWQIAVGAAGSEQVIWQAFEGAKTSGNEAQNPTLYKLDQPIPAGSRVSIRSTGASGGTHRAWVNFFSTGFMGSKNKTAVRLLNDGGIRTNLSPPLAANTLSPWTECVASLSHPVRGLYSVQLSPTSAGANMYFLLEIGIGPAGSEQTVATIPGDISSAENVSGRWPLSLHIPAGTRISARYVGDLTASNRVGVKLAGFGGPLTE